MLCGCLGCPESDHLHWWARHKSRGPSAAPITRTLWLQDKNKGGPSLPPTRVGGAAPLARALRGLQKGAGASPQRKEEATHPHWETAAPLTHRLFISLPLVGAAGLRYVGRFLAPETLPQFVHCSPLLGLRWERAGDPAALQGRSRAQPWRAGPGFSETLLLVPRSVGLWPVSPWTAQETPSWPFLIRTSETGVAYSLAEGRGQRCSKVHPELVSEVLGAAPPWASHWMSSAQKGGALPKPPPPGASAPHGCTPARDGQPSLGL